MTLSIATEAIECTVEGEISRELKAGSLDNGAPSWKSDYCLYKFVAENGNRSAPQGHIDLEDDEAQARLEDLLEREYGLSMEDVLERFSPETDLGSGEAVVWSFTDSICQLRQSRLVQPYNTTGEGGHDGDDRVVYEAVGAALRGGDDLSEWREMRVWVGESRVLEVAITARISSTTIGQRGHEIASDDADNDNVVDCSSVDSAPALRPHLLSGGVPVSAVDTLARAGFLGASSVADPADVLAALAEEAAHRKSVFTQSSPAIQQSEGVRGWPGVDPDRDGTLPLRLTSGKRSGSSATMHECTVAVTGTSESFKLEIFPASVGDDAPPASMKAMTISRLRPLATPAAKKRSWRGDPHEKHDTREDRAARTPRPEDASSKKGENSEADSSVGLNVGDRVEARFGGKTEWFPGTVRAINAVHEKEAPAGGTPTRSNLPSIAIDYDDGDVEDSVPRVRVRLPGQKQPRFLSEGDEVDFKRGKKIMLARVVVRSSSAPPIAEGRYDLELLDGGRRGVGGGGALVESCPRSAIMALHGWPPPRE